jgi:hypothetical protein
LEKCFVLNVELNGKTTIRDKKGRIVYLIYVNMEVAKGEYETEDEANKSAFDIFTYQALIKKQSNFMVEIQNTDTNSCTLSMTRF